MRTGHRTGHIAHDRASGRSASAGVGRIADAPSEGASAADWGICRLTQVHLRGRYRPSQGMPTCHRQGALDRHRCRGQPKPSDRCIRTGRSKCTAAFATPKWICGSVCTPHTCLGARRQRLPRRSQLSRRAIEGSRYDSVLGCQSMSRLNMHMRVPPTEQSNTVGH